MTTAELSVCFFSTGACRNEQHVRLYQDTSTASASQLQGLHNSLSCVISEISVIYMFINANFCHSPTPISRFSNIGSVSVCFIEIGICVISVKWYINFCCFADIANFSIFVI